MSITSDQIRAARAFLNLDQSDLADRAHVPERAITSIEDGGDSSSADASVIDQVRLALEKDGIEFIPDGVRRRPALTLEQQARYEKLRAISLQSAAELKSHEMLTDDDLYDENGLPA